MLLLGARTLTIEGITVFPDHADPNQFWYLPGPVRLARRREDGRADFTFLKYRPAAVSGGARGGGFLMFAVNLRLDAELERRILSRVAALAPGRPQLTAVPFDEGTIQCVALNLQGSGGTVAAAPAPGTFNAVERILGATTPSLQGDNTAMFSLTLDQEGTTILQEAFEGGMTPVGVIYDLKFTGMRPALDVTITADLERVYNQFSGSLSGQIYYVNAGIDAGFEKLVQDGAIKINVTNSTGEADKKEQEEWALNFFKEKLLAEWFEPTLSPGQIVGGIPQPESLDAMLRRGTELRPSTTPAPPPPGPPPAPTTPAATPPSPAAGTGQGAAPVGITPPTVAPASGSTATSTSPAAGTGSPPASAAVPPAIATGTNLRPPAAGNAPAGMASGGLALSPVSLRLRVSRQEERKTITLHYNRSEATQRTYAPQGFFGLLVGDLDRDTHFKEIDLDDPFFRTFIVTVDAPIDFAAIGLTSAHVTLDYGDPADAAHVKHGDFIFDTTNMAQKKFEVFMSASLDTAYTYSTQYHFSPTSGWEGSRFSYDGAPKRTEDRTLLINPYEELGFLEVRAFLHRIDKDLIDFTDVVLRYEGSGGQHLEQTLLLTPDGEPQFWRLRLDDRAARTYTYQFVHHLKDGTTRTSEQVTTRASAIPVDDPFPEALDIELIPVLDAARVQKAFVDITYSDPANGYQRELQADFEGNATASTKLRIALLDPTRRTFSYRLSFVTTTGLQRGPFIETTERRIAVMQP